MTGSAASVQPPPVVSAEAVRGFVDAAFESFDRAAAGPHDECDVAVAGRPLRIRFAAPALSARFLPAFHHLRAPAGEPDLTICCWDAAATDVALPPPPWPAHDFVRDSRIRGHITGPVVATYDRDGRLFQLYDRPSRRALFHVGNGGSLPDWHDRSPFRPFFTLWADDHGLALLHGATVSDGKGAVVVAGMSGAGKSTTAITCLASGLDFLGDDACLVDPDRASVHSLYGHAKLEPDAASSIADLTAVGRVKVDDGGATVLSPRRVARGADLRAILLVDIADQPGSRLSEPLQPTQALTRLMPTVREENHGLTPESYRALVAVTRAVPVRRLTVGSDRAATVRTVRRALAT